MTAPEPPARASWLARLVDVRSVEIAAVAWAWLFFFAVLSAYYVIRPIRDEMGVAGGVENLPWLFAGSLTGMLVLNPPFAYLVGRLPRARFVGWSYYFFVLNLLAFFVALRWGPGLQSVWLGRAFFIWTSIFNMFVVAFFWSVMADVFSPAQGKRLFGFIGAGGTIGGLTGAAITGALVSVIGTANLLLVSAGFLVLATVAARRLFAMREASRNVSAAARAHAEAGTAVALPEVGEEGETLIGGSVWDGMRRALTNPYLAHITLNMLLFTLLTTFLYFQQASIVDGAIPDRVARTEFFANIDVAVNVVTLVTELFATGWFVQRFGVSAGLAVLPAASIVGFAALGVWPTVSVLMAFVVLRRAGNFAVARPAREMLYTVVPASDRYKAKTFIDTVVYRAGDQLGAWMYGPLAALGAGVAGISTAAIALALLSLFNAVWLGRKMQRLPGRTGTSG
jgi:ATP:ADP antiporter, AAA family